MRRATDREIAEDIALQGERAAKPSWLKTMRWRYVGWPRTRFLWWCDLRVPFYTWKPR